MLLVVALQVLAELVVGRSYGLAMVAITPLALLVNVLVADIDAGALLRDRAVETVIGSLVGLAVAWASRLRPAVRREGARWSP